MALIALLSPRGGLLAQTTGTATFDMSSDAENSIGKGESFSGSLTMIATASDEDGDNTSGTPETIRLSTPSDSDPQLIVVFSYNPTGPLVPGTYDNAIGYHGFGEAPAEFTILWQGNGCSDSSHGNFAVAQFDYTYEPCEGSCNPFVVNRFAATFQQYCTPSSASISGSITFVNPDSGGTTTPTEPATPPNASWGVSSALLGANIGNMQIVSEPVSIFRLEGFESRLTLTAQAFPNDIDVAIDPSTADFDEDVDHRLTITTNGWTLPIPHIIVLIATDEDGTNYTQSFLIYVVCDPPLILGLPEDQPASQAVPYGTTATLTVNPTGGTQPYFYQWYQGHVGNYDVPIAGATEASYTTDPIMAPTDFWVSVRNACGEYRSWTATVTPTQSKGTTTGRRHGVRPGSGG